MPNPLADGTSARRHASVLAVSGGIGGLPGPAASISGALVLAEMIGATRWSCSAASPMWKSAPSGPAEAVAWPAGVNADSFVRRRAVDLIGEIDSSQMVPSLHRLSGEQSVTDQVRLGAANAVLSHSGSIVSLVDVGKDPTVNWTIRTEIAKQVAPIDPVIGAQLYILIAKSGPPTDRAKLTLLKEAHHHDSKPAGEAIVEFVKAARPPNQVHIEAVEMVRHTLTKPRVLDLFEGIGNTADGKVALSAGR